jgi:hypothetical protein
MDTSCLFFVASLFEMLQFFQVFFPVRRWLEAMCAQHLALKFAAAFYQNLERYQKDPIVGKECVSQDA